MKKIFKIVFIVAGVLVVVAVIAFCVAISYVDVAAERAVERGATRSLGVPTTLDSVRLAIISTTGTLKKLQVPNPPGFNTPHFLTLETGSVALDAASVLGDRIVIPTITLTGIDINFEENGGKKNYEAILANLKSYQATMPDTKSDAAAKPGKKFDIREVILKDVTIHADTNHGVGGDFQRVEMKIPELVLKDIGNDRDNGVAMEHVTAAIMTALFEAIASKGVGVLPLFMLTSITDGVIGLGDVGGKSAKVLLDVTGGTEKALGAVGKGTLDTVEEAGKGTVDAVGKGLGSLLGDEKDKQKKEDK